jgi:hypothetical protein
VCLEVNDLAISEYMAGRPKNLDFTKELAKHPMTGVEILMKRAEDTDAASKLGDIVQARIRCDLCDLVACQGPYGAVLLKEVNAT